jgi:hypothetical protein
MKIYKLKLKPSDDYINEVKKICASDGTAYAFKHGLDLGCRNGKTHEYMLLNLNLCVDISDIEGIEELELIQP